MRGQRSKPYYCLWCGDPAIGRHYGFAYCRQHRGVTKYDPEDLEDVVTARLLGKRPIPPGEKSNLGNAKADATT